MSHSAIKKCDVVQEEIVHPIARPHYVCRLLTIEVLGLTFSQGWFHFTQL